MIGGIPATPAAPPDGGVASTGPDEERDEAAAAFGALVAQLLGAATAPSPNGPTAPPVPPTATAPMATAPMATDPIATAMASAEAAPVTAPVADLVAPANRSDASPTPTTATTATTQSSPVPTSPGDAAPVATATSATATSTSTVPPSVTPDADRPRRVDDRPPRLDGPPATTSETSIPDPTSIAPGAEPPAPLAGDGPDATVEGPAPAPPVVAPTAAPLHRAAPATTAPAAPAPPAAPAAVPVHEQVATKVRSLRLDDDGPQSVTVDLHPAELGAVRVAVTVDRGTVHVALQAEHRATAALLHHHLDDLAHVLDASGLQVGDVAADVVETWTPPPAADHGERHGLDQRPTSRHPERDAHEPRGRRAHPDPALAFDALL